ncbi:hypothetical protein Hanom_Chr05g00426731 [Helianthus anomalus]
MCSFLLLFSICVLNLLVLIYVFDWGGDDEKKTCSFALQGLWTVGFSNLQPPFAAILII